jgi:hypothetical protein
MLAYLTAKTRKHTPLMLLCHLFLVALSPLLHAHSAEPAHHAGGIHAHFVPHMIGAGKQASTTSSQAIFTAEVAEARAFTDKNASNAIIGGQFDFSRHLSPAQIAVHTAPTAAPPAWRSTSPRSPSFPQAP